MIDRINICSDTEVNDNRANIGSIIEPKPKYFYAPPPPQYSSCAITFQASKSGKFSHAIEIILSTTLFFLELIDVLYSPW